MSKRSRILPVATILLALATLAAPADARRGGSFGSRGARTYSAPRAPYGGGYVAPVQRTMTPRSAMPAGQAYNPGFGGYAPRTGGGRFGGFGGGLLGGLVAGGLLGHFLGGGMGGGWGGGGAGGGFLLSLIQLAILGGIAWFVIGWFRRRRAAPAPLMRDQAYGSGFGGAPAAGPWSPARNAPAYQAGPQDDLDVTPADQDAFERLLVEVQDAFGREDYARLRSVTTPEIMSYLSEELSQNATQGRRNEVTGTRLIDAEVSEAWREAAGDYATIGLRYESVDLMRDRATGAIVGGSDRPTETTELWTFVRTPGQPWKLSAIQEV